jgi:hypothetical protein
LSQIPQVRWFVVVAMLVCCAVAGSVDQKIAAFIDIVRTEGSAPRAFEASARTLKLRKVAADRAEGTPIRMYLRRFAEMPGGARSWITFRVEASPAAVERAVIAKLGVHDGRGFGDEDGWLLPTGGLILERFDDRAHLTFSPGPAEDALEDLSKPHLPSLDELEHSLAAKGWRLMPAQTVTTNVKQRTAVRGEDELRVTYIDDARRLVAAHGMQAILLETIGVTVPNGQPCAAGGNYFFVQEEGAVTVWRRPFAMWNVDVQRQCNA